MTKRVSGSKTDTGPQLNFVTILGNNRILKQGSGGNQVCKAPQTLKT
jgi:hypothetical protein